MANALHRHTRFYGTVGPRNWYGDGSDGDIRITSAGAERSMDGGVTWAAIPTWTLVGTVVSIPSVQDGDMVVVNARNLTINSGYTLTVANRCRGLLIYCTGNATINGELSMTARGCHANPADAGVTGDTPVAPTDGNAVPSAGVVIRRLAVGSTDTNADTNLFYGCGQDAVDSEINQPEVNSNGIVINIPRVGGAGGAATAGSSVGNPGGTATNAPGGGGSGAAGIGGAQPGGTATCFSGGAGGGATDLLTGSPDPAGAGDNYGGSGGAGEDQGNVNPLAGGAGNPGGAGDSGGSNGNDGTGGLLLIIAHQLVGSGHMESEGIQAHAETYIDGSGSSGGGVIGVFVASDNSTVTYSIAGGVQSPGVRDGGPGGDGALIGPILINPA